MRRTPTKIKVAIARVPLRKAALVPAVVAPASRRSFPAWIDADDQAVAFPATAVTSRVRDGLVLRVVTRAKPVTKKVSHGPGAR